MRAPLIGRRGAVPRSLRLRLSAGSLIAAALLLFFAVPSLPLRAQELVVDGLGRSVPASPPATRVISLSPAATEVLFAVGAGSQVVAVTTYCDYPAEARTLPKVGGFSGASISVESVVSLKPDLVVLEAGMHERILGLLTKAGIRCYAADARRLEDAYRLIRDYGALTGRSSEAEAVSRRMRERIDRIKRLVSGRPTPSAFWEVWDDPLMTAGGGTFISDAIEAAGGRNVFASSREQWPTVSLEYVLAANPAWLLSGTDHGAKMNAQTLVARPGWGSLAAVREGRIALVDADSINRAGPRLADAVEALARVFHPDAFK